MFKLKKTIPTLAAGTLALAGCGDSGGTGFGGPGGGDIQQAIQSFCMKGAECGYDQNYCVQQLTQLAQGASAACTQAGLSYLQCGTAADCNAWMSEPITGCEAQTNALDAACE